MTAFVFNSAPLSSLNTGTYYVFPVSAAPVRTNTVVADVASISGFNPVILTGRNLTTAGLVFDDFEFPFFDYSTNVVGYVIAKQSFGSPQSSDPLLVYSSFINALLQDIYQPPGAYVNRFTVDTTTGVLRRISSYIYTSGPAYVPPPAVGDYPLGLLYLAGTRNNTVTFASPGDNSRFTVRRASDGATINTLLDRSFGPEAAACLIDCRLNAIRVGTMVIRAGTTVNNGLELYGSNTIPELAVTAANTDSLWADTSNWTLLGSGVNVPANNWARMDSVDKSTFWKYLKLRTSSGSDSHQAIEFLESSFRTAKENMAP